jgi:hypothetical protein
MNTDRFNLFYYHTFAGVVPLTPRTGRNDDTQICGECGESLRSIGNPHAESCSRRFCTICNRMKSECFCSIGLQ